MVDMEPARARSTRRRLAAVLLACAVGVAALVAVRAAPLSAKTVALAAFSDDERAADDDDGLLASMNVTEIEVIDANGTAEVVALRR